MKLSERTVKRLGEIITSNKGLSPYWGGPNDYPSSGPKLAAIMDLPRAPWG